MRALRKLNDWIARVEKGLLLSMLLLIVGINLLQIGIRVLQSAFRVVGSETVLNAPSWPADANRILVLWIAMVGGSLATLANEHIRVDFLSRLIRGALRNVVNGAICLVGVVVCGLLVYFSYQFLAMEFELKETLVAAPIPLWIIQMVIPVEFAVIGFRFMIHLLAGPGEAVPARPPELAVTEEGHA